MNISFSLFNNPAKEVITLILQIEKAEELDLKVIETGSNSGLTGS